MCRVEFSKIGKRDVTFIREMRVMTLVDIISKQVSDQTIVTSLEQLSIAEFGGE